MRLTTVNYLLRRLKLVHRKSFCLRMSKYRLRPYLTALCHQLGIVAGLTVGWCPSWHQYPPLLAPLQHDSILQIYSKCPTWRARSWNRSRRRHCIATWNKNRAATTIHCHLWTSLQKNVYKTITSEIHIISTINIIYACCSSCEAAASTVIVSAGAALRALATSGPPHS